MRFRKKIAIRVVVVPLLSAHPQAAQQVNTQRLAEIGVRNGHAMVDEGVRGRVIIMAYDEVRRKLIRFDGRYAGKPVGDTWEYEGQIWTRLNSSGPAPRNHTAMVYDPGTRAIVLFGGHDFGASDVSNVFGDTWELGASGWVLKNAGETRKRVENGH